GLIKAGEGGTLFLDEVDTLTPTAQVALLRVLQDKMFRALGSNREQHADVRCIAATNASLERLAQAGTFRQDLYYRLCVFLIRLPPLRDRKEDILTLAGHFLRKYTAPDRPALTISAAARAALWTFSWPGNVRELENTMIRAAQLCRTISIEPEDLGLSLSTVIASGLAEQGPKATTFKALKKLTINAFEREYLTRLMCEQEGNVTRAARVAGKERRGLGKLLRKHGLDPKLLSASATSRSNPGGSLPVTGSKYTQEPTP